MLIDNKINRYSEDGLDMKTVWDFINEYAGKSSGQEGEMDIVTGYFTVRALARLYHEIPETDQYRIVSSEMVKDDMEEERILDLLNGEPDFETAVDLDQYAQDAKAFLQRNNV